MKIINFLNISNLSNLQADSGYVFQKLLMKEILKKHLDWEFYYISPPGSEDIDNRIHLIELDYGYNKFETRFNFPWNDLKNKLEKIIPRIDLIYINQSEQASNFRALATSLVPNRKIPIVSYFHYLPIEPPHVHFDSTNLDYDLPVKEKNDSRPSSLRFDNTLNSNGLALPIFMRQIEAMQSSDYSIICSDFGIDLLLSNAQKLVPTTSPNIEAIPPPVSMDEAKIGQETDKSGLNQIIFNHRLYGHYGPEEFLGFMDSFYEKERQDFEVIITDPTQGRSKERDRLYPPIISTKNILTSKPYVRLKHSQERGEYYRTIGAAKISIGPFKPSALWSMSVVDSMASGTPTICPNYACFPEILGLDSNLLFSTKRGLSHLINALFDDNEFYDRSSDYCMERAKLFDVEKTAEKFVKIFEKVIKYE